MGRRTLRLRADLASAAAPPAPHRAEPACRGASGSAAATGLSPASIPPVSGIYSATQASASRPATRTSLTTSAACRASTCTTNEFVTCSSQGLHPSRPVRRCARPFRPRISGVARPSSRPRLWAEPARGRHAPASASNTRTSLCRGQCAHGGTVFACRNRGRHSSRRKTSSARRAKRAGRAPHSGG